MKRFVYSLAVFGFIATGITACNDRNNTTDETGDKKDTMLVDTRRNSTDTTNYITKDSGNQSQEVVDPNPPTNGKY